MSLPRPVLIDMPWHIKQKIVGNTNAITRLVLRKTTKEFREQVDCSPYPANLRSVVLRLYKNSVVVDFFYGDEMFTVDYSEADSHSVTKLKKNVRILCGMFDKVKQAVSDISTIFANRRVSVEDFVVYSTNYVDRSVKRSLRKFLTEKASFLNVFQEKFSQLPERAQIKNVYFEWALSENEMMQLIPLLNAKSLKNLEVKATEENTMENVLETEQFRNLKSLQVENGNRVLGSFLTAQLPRSMTLRNVTATTAELTVLLEKLLQNTDECDFFTLENIECDIPDFLNHIITLHQLNPDDAEKLAIKIPNSDKYLFVTFDDTDLDFDKIDQVLALRLLQGDFV